MQTDPRLAAALTRRQIINGASVASVNPATLANPECLEYYVEIGKKLAAEVS